MHCRGLRMGHQSIQVSGEADLSSRADLCCSYPLQLISYPLQLNILPPCSAPTSSTNCTPAKFLYKYLWNIPATYLIHKNLSCCSYSRDFTFYNQPQPQMKIFHKPTLFLIFIQISKCLLNYPRFSNPHKNAKCYQIFVRYLFFIRYFCCP